MMARETVLITYDKDEIRVWWNTQENARDRTVKTLGERLETKIF